MRAVSARWRQMVGSVVRWTTRCEWSNDGGQVWRDCTYLGGGTVTAASTSQIRWTCQGITITGPDVDQINPFTTRLRILHGMAGEPPLPMGVYVVTDREQSSDYADAYTVTGKSFELYLQRARFLTMQTSYPQPARVLLNTLITKVLPRAQISWRPGVDADLPLPSITEPRDRWPLIDGDRDATSIARALGARVFAGPAGGWTVAPVPTLQDPPVWEAREGRGGVLLSHSESLSSEGVYNIQVVNGEALDGDTPPFKAGIAADLDPLSPTYTERSPDDGGFGPCPRFYASPLIRSTAAAQKAAQGMLAPYLGLKQKITYSQMHDPAIEPGDVGIVHTKWGPRRVILDAVTYNLDGGPLSGETRTTATRLAGQITDAPQDTGGAGE